MARFRKWLGASLYNALALSGLLALVRAPRKWMIARYPWYQELDRRITHWALGKLAKVSLRRVMAKGKVTPQIVTLISLRLWSGHSPDAEVMLRNISTMEQLPQKIRASAALSLAVFLASKDKEPLALELLESIANFEMESRDDVRFKLLQAGILWRSGRAGELSRLTQGWLEAVERPDLFWIALNTLNSVDGAQNAEEWFRRVNGVYESHGLLSLSAREPELGVQLNNLCCIGDSVSGPQPLVSVIIPAFNAGDRISTALDSLLQQTWRNLEVIIVDDCSPDDTVAVVESYMEKDARVKLVRQTRNGGCYLARNAGLKAAEGQFVTTHDIDDWSHAEKIERQVRPLLNNHDIIATISHALRCTDEMVMLEKHRALTVSVLLENSSSLLFRRSIVQDIGCWDGVRTGGDSEFIKRIRLKYGAKAIETVLADVPLSFVLGGHDSLTNAGATHISSLYYGVRREYNALYSYWHNQFKKGEIRSLADAVENKPLQSIQPLIRPAKEHQLTVDALIVLDGVEDYQAIRDVVRLVESGPERIAIFHWPSMDTHPTMDVHKSLRRLVYNGRLDSVVLGQQCFAKRCIVYGGTGLESIPDKLPKFSVSEVLIDQRFKVKPQIAEWFDVAFQKQPTPVPRAALLGPLSS